MPLNAVITHPAELTREQWLAKRCQGIGGSEAAAVMGLNPWLSNVDLWEIKTGRREAEDISVKDYVQYGIEAEKPLRELFAMDHPELEVHYRENDIRFSKDYPFLFVSLDGWTVDKATGENGILEIKTTNILNSMSREKWNDQIPETYFIQILHGLSVLGWPGARLKAALKSVWDGEIRTTHRHYSLNADGFRKDIDKVLEETCRFCEYNIQRDIRPNLILPQI